MTVSAYASARRLRLLGGSAVFVACMLPAVAFAQAAAEAASPSAAPADGDQDSSEIVVTGTSIRGVAPTGSNLIAVTQDQIRATSVTSTSELLATIPQLGSFGTRPHPGPDAGFPQTAFDIRGIGANFTLTLVNGRRQVGIGIVNTLADPSALPPAAIERVEVLPDGTSAVYGSDAVAGVVNVILRRDFDGLDASASYGFASGYRELQGSVVGGRKWSTGSLLVGYQYRRNSAIGGAERSYNTLDLTALGGPDSRSTNTPAPNVVYNGVNYAAPAFLPNTTNRLDTAKDSDIIPRGHYHSIVASVRQDVGDNVKLFADANYTERHFFIRTPRAGTSFTIDNTNPFFIAPPGTNATSETVNFSFRDLLGPYQGNRSELQSFGLAGGADIALSNRWSLEVAGNYGYGLTDFYAYQLNQPAITAAVAGTNRANALDPFGNGTSPAVLNSILDYETDPRAKQHLYQGTAKLDGSVIDLPGGSLRLALGAEARKEEFSSAQPSGPRGAPTGGPVAAADRKVYSAFAEIFVPIFGEANSRPGFRSLELSVAARYDHYSDFGSTTNPKFGISWTPVTGVKLRGSYGTSFQAPSLANINGIDSRVEAFSNVFAPGFFNPPTATGPQNVAVIFGGNPNLKPVTSKSWSGGFDLVPTGIPGFRASATYFKLNIKGEIGLPLFSNLFFNPALRSYYIIGPTDAQIDAVRGTTPYGAFRFPPGGTDILVDSRYYNLNQRKIDGIDFATSYRFSTTSAGNFDVGAGGVVFLTNKSATTGASFQNLLNTGTVRWRARGALGWEFEGLHANAYVNHIGTYKNLQANPVQKVNDFTTIDLRLAYDFQLGAKLKTQLFVSADNVFDKDPPRVIASGQFPPSGGYSTQANPIGRMVQVGLRLSL